MITIIIIINLFLDHIYNIIYIYMLLTKNLLINLAKFANLSYYSRQKIETFYNTKSYPNEFCNVLNLCNECPDFINSAENTNEDCQLFDIKYNDILIFSFRGTESKQQIIFIYYIIYINV